MLLAQADNTCTETLIIPDITKTKSNKCFIIPCFKTNNDKRSVAGNPVNYFPTRIEFTIYELDIALGNHALYALYRE